MDPETGLIYLRARYYDPATAQFLTRDPAVATTGQPYSYAHDNPLNEVDPFGLAAYHYSFDLGPLGSPEELAAYTRANCSSLFPITGCVDNFGVGDTMHLHKSSLLYTQSFPVKVINETSTSFERPDMAIQKHLLGLVQIDPVEPRPDADRRITNIHPRSAGRREEADIAEVDLGFGTQRMRLGHHRLPQHRRLGPGDQLSVMSSNTEYVGSRGLLSS